MTDIDLPADAAILLDSALDRLADSERTHCEIWSRVMGYHRPVEHWNQGKQQEHCDRKHFEECKWHSS